jgi:hypothetical protein
MFRAKWIFGLVDLGFSSACGALFLLSIFSQDIPAAWSVSAFFLGPAISYVPAISHVTVSGARNQFQKQFENNTQARFGGRAV